MRYNESTMEETFICTLKDQNYTATELKELLKTIYPNGVIKKLSMVSCTVNEIEDRVVIEYDYYPNITKFLGMECKDSLIENCVFEI